jgi:radical SAM PhpK family P-methyltransferase
MANMVSQGALDCVVIGYNEPTLGEYADLVARYGRGSETYRDLRFSFVEIGGQRFDYAGLLNHAYELAHPDDPPLAAADRIKSGDIPNLAAAYLTSLLRRRYTAEYINLYQFEKAHLAALLERGVRCVAITTTFYVFNLPVIEIVRFVRERRPDTTIVVGGPLVGNHVRRCTAEELHPVLEEIGADVYVVDSQGEATLQLVVEAVKCGSPLAAVPNIIYRDGRRLRRTLPAPENNSLDENAIDWRGLADRPLGPTLQSRTARSCAFSCAFCAYPTRAGGLTLASIDTVVRELESMRAVGGVRNVVFIDDTFNVPLPRFKELCRRMIAGRFQFDWFSYLRCSNVDEEAVALAAESGCRGVFLGVESASNEVLKHMNKAATIEHYRRGIDLLRRHGILTFGSFIAGHPGETKETFRETVDFIRETRLDYYRIQLWYCEPGTPIVEQRASWDIRGNGFRWQHRTMTSQMAMGLIEEAFLEIEESVWLPQWSFDFWIIPYLRGRGMTAEIFRLAMIAAGRLLALEIRGVDGPERSVAQTNALAELASIMRGIRLERNEAVG